MTHGRKPTLEEYSQANRNGEISSEKNITETYDIRPANINYDRANTTVSGNNKSESRHTLYLIAAIINWIALGSSFIAFIIYAFSYSMVFLIFAFLPFAWIIPMTIKVHKYSKDVKKHVALGVCTLLFINVISGILILAAGGED